jgi:hypothetical protein
MTNLPQFSKSEVNVIFATINNADIAQQFNATLILYNTRAIFFNFHQMQKIQHLVTNYSLWVWALQDASI